MACGYRFSGGGPLPGGIQNVCVAVLENPTAETGIESILSNDLIQEFTRSGYPVVRTTANADATLSGRIASLYNEPISRRGPQSTQESRVTIALNLRLVDPSENVIWSVNGISESQTYEVVTGDKTATEQNRRLAIEILSRRLAQTVYNHLTADF